MYNKKIIVFLSLALASFTEQGYELWLQPAKFVVKPGESVSVTFKEGEDFFGKQWSFTKDKIAKVELHYKNTVKDVMKEVSDVNKVNLQTPLANEGTHMLAMQTVETYAEWEAEAFNNYLREDELDDAYAIREKRNSLNDVGKELFVKYTKLIVQAGDKTDNTFRKTVGFPVEIVPEQNPYTLKVGDPVQFKILYQGKPLFGAKVRVWNFNNNRTSVQNIYSQQDGMISTHISNPGAWMVSLVKMVPSKDPQADWQSHWTSLVFGIK